MKAKLIFALVVASAALSGCIRNEGRQESSTVTVSGVGTVSIVPDMMRMTVSVSETAQTTRLAQEAVNGGVARILDILKDAGVEDKDISTASLTFNPEYEWRNNRNALVGQRAEQRIDFAVRGIGEDSRKVSGIVDLLAGIDGISLGSINFDISDDSEYFARSRELAFEKARQKAEQYASLSGLKVDRVLGLSEDGAGSIAPFPRATNMYNMYKMEAVSAVADAATALPSGQSEVTTRISVVFILR